MLTNINGAHHGLRLAKKLNIPILQASTSEVYGNPTVHPQVETYWGNVNPIGVRSCYDEGKRVAETMMYAYEKQANLEVR
jgi:UDP-glucuronate decarboxylase